MKPADGKLTYNEVLVFEGIMKGYIYTCILCSHIISHIPHKSSHCRTGGHFSSTDEIFFLNDGSKTE